METVITENLKQTIRKAKRQGTTGASYACLMQITPTKGVHGLTPEGYRRLFRELAGPVAKKLRFTVYH